MPCTPVEFNNVTRKRWEQIKAVAQTKAGGLALTADVGEAKYDGFKLRWEYNEQTLMLLVTCLEKPFYVPERAVNNRLREEFSKF